MSNILQVNNKDNRTMSVASFVNLKHFVLYCTVNSPGNSDLLTSAKKC